MFLNLSACLNTRKIRLDYEKDDDGSVMVPITGSERSEERGPEYQWLFSKSDLHLTPSVLVAGIDTSSERQLRCKGIGLIYRVGDFMRLGQHVLNTACIFFHRFFMRKPLTYGPDRLGYGHYEMAATCIFLACKVEETHRKLPSIIEATMASLDKSPDGLRSWADRSFRANPASKDFARWRDIILVFEEVLLESLCFDLIVEHPHEILVKACFRLGVKNEVVRLAWTILNDCMRDPLCVMYEAPVLAAGAFRRACLANDIDPQTFTAEWSGTVEDKDKEEMRIHWEDVFDVDDSEARETADAIDKDVYEFHKELS
ncbi:cyclin-like protein [Testicularia cyperi]|uniref:Cyclin-like protein n=1 Tax=Testicularia cyperi TaxID=1882483 RepID=A0A317XS66_9BASI|nr:cyclin-like protein [Testicularia cyperi]